VPKVFRSADVSFLVLQRVAVNGNRLDHRLSIPDGVHLFSFRHHVWASKEFLIQWVLVALYPGVRWLERKVDHCLLSVADVKESMDLVLRMSSLCGAYSAMRAVTAVSHVLVFIRLFVNGGSGKIFARKRDELTRGSRKVRNDSSHNLYFLPE